MWGSRREVLESDKGVVRCVCVCWGGGQTEQTADRQMAADKCFQVDERAQLKGDCFDSLSV